MKKIFTTIIALVFGISTLTAQDAVFQKGTSAINLGFGLGSTAFTGAYYSGFSPGISASYEMGIVEIPMGESLTGVVSVGGILGFGSARYEYTFWNDVRYQYTYFAFAARGNYHFIFHDKLDPYAGIILGYYIASGKWKGSGTHPTDYTSKTNGFIGGAYAGARWYFTDAIAVFAELGWGITVLTIGGTFKF